MNKLILFDIDGTILLTHGVGRRSVEASLSQVFDRPIQTEGISFSGKTDPQIIREVLLANEVDAETVSERFAEALEAYADALRAVIDPEHVEVLPGAGELVRHLHEDTRMQLALLTGNLEPMAYLKLDAVGLSDYFPFGAFGSDSADRNDLPAIAVARAKKHTGIDFTSSDVVIIGDTEHDIRCARTIDAFAVAVCTGRFTRTDLEAHAPHLLLDDLSCLDTFLSGIDRALPEEI